MTSLIEFAATVITISVSGVMSPGPLFAANVAYGVKGGWKTGLRLAYGHTIVEFPLVILLGLGAISLSALPQFREYVSILGALSLFGLGGLQIRNVLKKSASQYTPNHGPFLIGMLLTALNPFFLVWWFTIGFKLISDALLLYSLIGIVVMFAFHIWMDYAWLGIVGYFAGRGKKILVSQNYNIFMLAISCILIYFGISFLIQALR